MMVPIQCVSNLLNKFSVNRTPSEWIRMVIRQLRIISDDFHDNLDQSKLHIELMLLQNVFKGYNVETVHDVIKVLNCGEEMVSEL